MAMQNKNSVNALPALLLVFGILAVAALIGLFAFRQEAETIQGQVEVTEYRVTSKVPGRIFRYFVREGDYVKQGDTLALLEAPDISAKYEQARAAEAAAQAQRRKADKGSREEQKQAAFEMWQKAKAGVDIAEKSYHRVKNLYDQGVTTAQKLDEVAAQRDAAVATEKAARAQYEMAVNGVEREDKEAAAALAAQAHGVVSELSSYIDETILVALADGEVSEIFPQVGELVGTGAPVMNVARMDDMWVSFNVREDMLSAFSVGKVIQAVVPALGNRSVSLKVYAMKDLGSYAAWKATKATGQFDMKTFEVKAAPVTPVDGLRPGMSVIFTP